MHKKIDFSLICATIDSTQEVESFLKNLKSAIDRTKEQIKIDLILIDQFKESRKNYFLKIYPELTYVHSLKKGLSLNRNIGINLIRSKSYAFIDCDCRIDELYFHYFLKLKNAYPKASLIYGKIVSTDNGSDLFKKWPKQNKKLSKLEKWRISTSVNIIYLNGDKIYFDERLGIGSEFGSCEDIDYAIRHSGTAIYSPNLLVKHPNQTFIEVSENKITSYSRGYGALCRKHLSITSISLLLASIFYKILSIALRKSTIKKTIISVRARLEGFYKFH